MRLNMIFFNGLKKAFKKIVELRLAKQAFGLSEFRKYFQVTKNTASEYLVYRLNFFMWRVRSFVRILALYFFWLAVFGQKGELFGYEKKTLLTYILGSLLVTSIILSSRVGEVGVEINRGDLTNFLLRPINYFKYWFFRDLADKLFNVFFAIFELAILYLILKPPIIIQKNLIVLLFFGIFIIIGFFLNFYLNFLLGLLGFWTPEVWGPRFVYLIILQFFAGSIFPLDILPKVIYQMLLFSPFSYLLFFPLKVYLGRLSVGEILLGFLISLIWLGIIYQITQLAWQKGLRIYAAYGR